MTVLTVRETIRHKQAFEYYVSLGVERTLSAVGRAFKVSDQSITNWNHSFHWQERTKERDDKNAQAIATKTDKEIVRNKAYYRREVQDSLKVVRAALVTIVDGIREKRIIGNSVADLARLTDAQDKLIRLDQYLLGEADSRSEIVIKVKYVRPDTITVENRAGDSGDREAFLVAPAELE